MSQRKTERWNRKLADLTVTYAGHPLLSELENLLGNYGKLERRLEKVASISDKMQSEMIRLNEAQHSSDARYRMLAESMADVVWTLDFATLRFTYVSPSVQKLRGYTPNEVMAAPWDAAIAPQQRQEIRAVMAQRAADLRAEKLGPDNTFVDELEQPLKGGGSVWTEVLTRYILDPQSGQIELHGVTRDISERRRIQARLFVTIKDLEQAEAEQRQLLSIASHEFRTPAAMIQASLDSLAILNDRIPPEVAQRLDNIRQASLRLNRLANNLISHDRLQELALKPQKQVVDMGQLVREVVGKYPADKALKIQLPGHPVVLDVDAVLLGIALHNLVDNALRYHATFDSPIHVSLAENRGTSGCSVELRVADQGSGIADGEKEKIFQRFYSAKGGQCDGIGLSIVHSVARAHGGIAFVLDNTPQGAVFVIKLPGNRDGAISFEDTHANESYAAS